GAEPSAVLKLAASHAILALVDVKGGQRFPEFQFSDEGSLYPEVSEVLRVLSPHAESAYTVASWFVNEQSLLNETPATWIAGRRDPAKLILAAKRDAARLAR